MKSSFDGLARDQRAGDPAVAQHGRAVGDLHHLVDVVGDEDDAGAIGDDAPDHVEQRSTSRRGRNGVGSSRTSRPPPAAPPGRDRSTARTIASSARSTGESVATSSRRVDADAVARRTGPPPARARAASRAASAALAARRPISEVLDHRQRRDQAEMLMDEADAELAERARRQRQRHGLAIDREAAAGVGLVEARPGP